MEVIYLLYTVGIELVRINWGIVVPPPPPRFRFDKMLLNCVFSPLAQWMVQTWAQGQVPVRPPMVWMLRCLPAPAALLLVMSSTETPHPTPPQSTSRQTVTRRVGRVSVLFRLYCTMCELQYLSKIFKIESLGFQGGTLQILRCVLFGYVALVQHIDWIYPISYRLSKRHYNANHYPTTNTCASFQQLFIGLPGLGSGHFKVKFFMVHLVLVNSREDQ